MISILLFVFIPLVIGIPECDLDKYEIIEDISGSGGQSTIKLIRAVDPTEKREGEGKATIPIDSKVAVMKIYNKRQEYLRELEVLSNLNHPNIIKPICRSANRRYNSHFIVFPFYKEGTLDTVDYGLSDKQMVMISAQIVSAVWYLHKVGFTHQDIKPTNILLDDSLNAILIDFALTRRIGMEEPRTGSISTMAPEVLAYSDKRRPLLCPSLDWWGVGVTLWMVNESIKIPPEHDEGRTRNRVGPFRMAKGEAGESIECTFFYPRSIPAHFGLDFLQLVGALLKQDQHNRSFYGNNRALFEMDYFRDVQWDENFIPIAVLD